MNQITLSLLLTIFICLINAHNTHNNLHWWKTTPTGAIPTNISGSVVAYHTTGFGWNKQKYFYILTGHVENWFPSGTEITFTNDVYRLNLNTFVWELVDVQGVRPDERVYASGVKNDVTDEVYLYGGVTFDNAYGNINLKNDLWVFDLDTHTWTLRSSGVGPDFRAGSGIHLKYNKLYVFGGINGLLQGEGYELPLYGDDIWAYDLSTSTWTQVAATGPGARQVPQTISFFGNFYINGGENFDLNTFSFVTPEDTWKFSGNSWTDNTPANSEDNILPARNYALSATMGYKWLIYGGELEGPQLEGCGAPFGQNVGDDTWLFNFWTKKWTQVYPTGQAPGPLKRPMSVNVAWNKIVVVGGYDFQCADGVGGQIYNNDVYVLQSY